MNFLTFLRHFNKWAVFIGAAFALAYTYTVVGKPDTDLGHSALFFHGIVFVSMFCAMVLVVYVAVAFAWAISTTVKRLQAKKTAAVVEVK